MKRLVLLFFLFVLLICPPVLVEAEEWFKGGTLHKATVREWNNASYRNRLATAGDWFTSMTKSHNPSLQKKLDAVTDYNAWLVMTKILVEELEVCVTDLVADKRTFSPDNKIAEASAMCYTYMYLTSKSKASKKTNTNRSTTYKKKYTGATEQDVTGPYTLYTPPKPLYSAATKDKMSSEKIERMLCGAWTVFDTKITYYPDGTYTEKGVSYKLDGEWRVEDGNLYHTGDKPLRMLIVEIGKKNAVFRDDDGKAFTGVRGH